MTYNPMLDKALPGAMFPPTRAVGVTKSDVTELEVGTKGLYVGGAGDVAVILYGDSTAVTLKDVQSGAVLPLAVKKVMETGTTATDIVAFSGP
jgi:hypothetical protein